MVAHGDDLDDDYAPDDLVAQSDDDDSGELAHLEGEEDQFEADEDADDENVTASNTTAQPPLPPTSASKSSIHTTAPTQSDDATREKKRKKRAKDNERKAKVRLTYNRPLRSFFFSLKNMLFFFHSLETTANAR